MVYQGEGTAEKSSAMHRWTLYLHQSFVLWEEGAGVQTGRALAEDDEGYAHGIVRIETRLIEYNEKADHRLIESAIGVIESAPIPSEIQKNILHHLKGVLS